MPCREGCGACCDPVFLPGKSAKMIYDAAWGPLTKDQAEDSEFILAHWAPYASWGEDGVALQCSEYDAATRSCLAYDNRPPVCRNYPTYNRERPEFTGTGTNLVCGYQAEDGRTVLVLEVLRG